MPIGPRSAPDGTQEFPQLARYLAELSPQPMVAVEGLTHVVRYANPAFCRLAGRDNRDLVGVPFDEAVPEGAANECSEMLDRVFSTGAAERLSEQEHEPGAWVGTGKSSTFWSYLAWAILGPAKDGREAPVGVMIQVTDATEVATYRGQLAAINEALLLSGIRQQERTRGA